MRYFFLFLISLLIFPSIVVASTLPVNAGLVDGLWYSKKPFFVGDDIRIYSAIQNQSKYDIIGKVNFLIDSKVIQQSDFSVINGRLVEKWVDWKVTAGSHDIEVIIVEAKKSVIGENPESVTLAFLSTKINTSDIDFDTDDDGIGNEKDTDDDNDGLADSKEIELKTNPLISDTDGDGVKDGTEIERGMDPTKADNSLYKEEALNLKDAGLKFNEQNSTSSEKNGLNKTDIIKNTAINVPTTISQKIDDLNDSLKIIRSNSENVIYSSSTATGTTKNTASAVQSSYLYFLNFLIFILSHKVLLLAVVVAIGYILYKITKFIFSRHKKKDN